MLIHDAILDFGDVCLAVYWRFYLQKGASGDTDHGDLAAPQSVVDAMVISLLLPQSVVDAMV